MFNKFQLFGKKGETLAVRHLKKKGYRIVKTNYKNALGEIDVICMDKDEIVFVEVKSRKTLRYGEPKTAVTLKKQKKIVNVAQAYLKDVLFKDKNKTGFSRSLRARFDVVSVMMNEQGETSVEIIKNAFGLGNAY